MSRLVRLATCQPLAPGEGRRQADIERHALALLSQAGDMGADIACLPESLNVVGLELEEALARADVSASDLLAAAAKVCERHRMHAVVPLMRGADGELRNTAFLLDREGKVVGEYDKVHLTKTERDVWGLTPGHSYPVFGLDFGCVGVMICYDGCFPEPARILALAGAEVVFFPSLQRSYTETHLALQARARAYDNFVHVVRSSYGTDPSKAWRPGKMVGKSCIVGPDATILADLGRSTGVVTCDIDLDAPEVGERSSGGEVGVLRDMRMEDRRPETYGKLCE